MSRTQNAWLRLFLYLACVVLFLGGGLIGIFAVWGMFDHERPIPTPHDKTIGTIALFTWVGILLLYMILDRRRLRQRIRGYDSASYEGSSVKR
jgi:hypothetical protein